MAFSASEGKLLFKDWLIHMAKPLGFNRFLDVGCGAGLYGDLIREVFGREVTIEAVEPFQTYIFRHNLCEKYDMVWNREIQGLCKELPDYDLIVAGDILEHLTKEDAIEVVSWLRLHCRFLWGALPVKMGRSWSTGYLQGPVDYEENELNKHLWDWTGDEIQKEFSPMWLCPFIQTGCFLIEGKIQ